jgi:cell division protein FtsQ
MVGGGVISGSWVRERRFSLPHAWPRRLLPRRLRSPQTLALLLVLAGCGWLGWLWYRSSSFVKVERVTVTGLSGPDVPQISAALTSAALQMTTMNMDITKLEAAVSRYAYVRALAVTPDGSHGVTIHVSEQVPVALVQVGSSTEVVDAQGMLLQTSSPHGPLPIVPMRSMPMGGAISAPGARAAVAALAAAPYAFIAHIADATTTSAHGVTIQLRNGPVLYFGSTAELAQKWDSTVAVLRSRYAAGASYIDLSDPQRPAAGTSVTSTQASALGLGGGTSTTTAGTSTTTAGTSTTTAGTSTTTSTSG